MSQEQRLHDTIGKAKLAKEIRSNPLFNSFMMSEKARLYQEFCDTDMSQGDKLKENKRMMNTFQRFESMIDQALDDGVVASEKLSLTDRGNEFLKKRFPTLKG